MLFKSISEELRALVDITDSVSDCDLFERAASELDRLEAENEALRTELGMVADYVERHWQGAGLPLKADWIIRKIDGWTTDLDLQAEAAEAADAKLKRLCAAIDDFYRAALEAKP